MNTDHLTDDEFLRYLDTVGTNDPIVKRLMRIASPHAKEIEELIKSGMDRNTWQFVYEGLEYPVSDYIDKLHREIDYRDREITNLQDEVHEVTKERDKWAARPVSEVIAELHTAIGHSDAKALSYKREAERADARMQEAQEKLDVWNIMRT